MLKISGYFSASNKKYDARVIPRTILEKFMFIEGITIHIGKKTKSRW